MTEIQIFLNRKWVFFILMFNSIHQICDVVCCEYNILQINFHKSLAPSSSHLTVRWLTVSHY